MGVVIVTGAAGLVGSESVRFFNKKGYDIVGIDNDLRSYFFGEESSTQTNLKKIKEHISRYAHYNIDIRDLNSLTTIFQKYNTDIEIIIHTAAQPSHDWAAKEPLTDFTVNANGTLNLLECFRQYCPGASFIYTSTNKVYGDTPNNIPLMEQELRWEPWLANKYFEFGIDESMSIDASTHSLFGVSKLAGDLAVQEYGRYFGLNTVCFRGGCLTGPAHTGAELHGFLSYLVLCALNNKPYTIFGYKGKQVRDNIHSHDLVNAFWYYIQSPRPGEVYNIGGSRYSNCSILEAIKIIENISGKKLDYTISENHRVGDHQWYISDVRKFQNHYQDWKYTYNIEMILNDMIEAANR